jgi:predicted dehydrogenase
VICDKPITTTYDDAKKLEGIIDKTGRALAITHAYVGYPLVKQARYMAREGLLGKIFKIVVEYPQGWLPFRMSIGAKREDIWRLNPKRVGRALCMGDIGIHAENLVRYITGFEIEELCADLSTFLEGSSLDDDGTVLIHYRGGAKGVLLASQTSTGEENGLKIRIYGTKLGIEWEQENPNSLLVKTIDRKTTIYSKGGSYLCDKALAAQRLPGGHPDGLIEAFANIYREFFRAVWTDLPERKSGSFDFPDIRDGLASMAFIETVLESADSDKKWVKLKG